MMTCRLEHALVEPALGEADVLHGGATEWRVLDEVHVDGARKDQMVLEDTQPWEKWRDMRIHLHK